jgi:hypothetical protein
MQDEWTKVISGEGLVKFTCQELWEDGAFLTAQIGSIVKPLDIISNTELSKKRG